MRLPQYVSFFTVLVVFGCSDARRSAATTPICEYDNWISGIDYCLGDRVTHTGRSWEAKWCTQVEPGTDDPNWGAWTDLGLCSEGPAPTPTGSPTPTPTPTGSPTPTPTSSPSPTPDPTPGPSDSKLVGYFVEWGVFGREYYPKNIITSGSAEKLTHLIYAFGSVGADGSCSIYDTWPATDMAYEAANSVDGVADTWDQPLKGNFNQLRKLKVMYPHLKILWSFGGWTLSGNFGAASENAEFFAESCYNLVHDARWEGLFDGIDIDWEYPNANGLTPDNSGPLAYNTLMTAVRNKFGTDSLVTSAVAADGSDGGKVEATDYGLASEQLDFMMAMTYDYFGYWPPYEDGPTEPHAPLTTFPEIPEEDSQMYAAQGIDKLLEQGVPPEKLLFGIPFYGRGWTGVTQSTPGGSATGPGRGVWEDGNNDYKVLAESCPVTGYVASTAYAYCDPEWWSYDDPSTVSAKVTWASAKGLGGAFFWELSGDTAEGKLISSMYSPMSKFMGHKAYTCKVSK